MYDQFLFWIMTPGYIEIGAGLLYLAIMAIGIPVCAGRKEQE